MAFPNSQIDWPVIVAGAADVCLKPFKHAAIYINHDMKDINQDNDSFEFIKRIESRNIQGIRQPANDLELEIYRSGNNLSLILGWCNQVDRPILWQGQHSIWMDGNSGQRCNVPTDGMPLESLARRLRSLFGDEVVDSSHINSYQ